MARTLASKVNVDAPGGNYPYGRPRNNTGSGNGTPVDEEFVGDLTQFFERLLAVGGVTANGLPENSANGFQYVTALAAYIVSLAVARSGSSMTGNLAMGGNKVTGLAASTANGDAVRYEQLTTEQSTRSSADTTLQNNINALTNQAGGLYRKIVNIGDWNMDSDDVVSVTHGLDLTKIRDIRAFIRNDANDRYMPLDRVQQADLSTASGGITFAGATTVQLGRLTGGEFDSASYDQTSYNRGYVIFEYVA